MNKEMMRKEGPKLLGVALGAFVYAVGVNLFIVPSGLYTGGVLGFCQVLRTLLVEYLHLPLAHFDFAGMIYYAANVPLFLWAYKSIGKKFFVKTVVSVTIMSAILSMFPTHLVVEDQLTSCIIGGIVSGAGVGVILRMGGSGGGMDIVGMVLTKKKQNYSVGKVNLVINMGLYLTCLFLFDIETVIYSMIYSAVYSVAIDKIHIQNINVEVNVITKVNSPEMEREVFDVIGRGITKWQAVGAYTHEESQLLFITLSKYEVNQLKAIVRKYDPQAFIVVNEGVQVDGHFIKKL